LHSPFYDVLTDSVHGSNGTASLMYLEAVAGVHIGTFYAWMDSVTVKSDAP
jgi:hypothetical protein